MFDLQARIDLDKVKVALRVAQEFCSSSIQIVYSINCSYCNLTNTFSCLLIYYRSRRHFNELLMTPLNRTFSFKQMPAVSLRIAYELKFDVPDTLEVFFYKQGCLAKSCARLCGRHFELLSQLLFIVSKSNASASTSKGGLEQNRVAGFVSNISRFVHIFNNAIASRHRWNFGLFHDSFAFHLVASKFHSFASWPDKDDTIFFAHLRKVLIL